MSKKPLTLKSSSVLERALKKLQDGTQTFACAAIMDTELDFSNENGGRQVKSNALQFMLKYKPSIILDNMKMTQPWWAKGDSARVEAVQNAIQDAVKKGD